ncbi:structural maintenance of chromosomes flexible hinge domain-containing protein 1 [Pungitius pungitius]|uniref:structural maintenance of chromosomes flexible hinge domain-containing protein 1 n=1 Tax=Pungitius pungitius TaxID=134920 RepID=UPI002E12C16D
MEGQRKGRCVTVYDCRYENKARPRREVLETSGLNFNAFLLLLQRKFSIHSHETFVLATTDRIVLDFDKFEELQDGSTLHLLQQEGQALTGATEEHINFTPHYDTLIKGGLHEYYASESQNPLAYALAELIDNSLSATARNPGVRTVEIRMVFDGTQGKPTVIVLDNGCGMTSKQLKNWAVYRLSKFSREGVTVGGKLEGYTRPEAVPRSLNSDISYFGVGGKQAVFFIGNSARMITKPAGSPDVHELVLSKEEFESRERDKRDIYSTVIKNRKPGDSSHVKEDERCLRALIAEESGKESFTAVVIGGVLQHHIAFLKRDFRVLTRQLANLYHYYIHGVHGKDPKSCSATADHLPKIDIQITLREKPPKCPRALNLREVDDDRQTLFLGAAVDAFEFNCATEDGGTVEGVIRYHPFLYDRETYPQDPDAPPDFHEDDNDCDKESAAGQQAGARKPIFDCFWNGRLIPYTKLHEFDWCAANKGPKELAECYGRISGALFSDDRFNVSTNKLTFMNLELKLKQKSTIFTRVVNSQKQRGKILKEFTEWLKNCHEKFDKQVKFMGFKGTITRTDLTTKRMQHPWATFSSIEWDGQEYATGQLVKSRKTVPIVYGRVGRFLLHGEHKGNVFATGGEVEVVLEPKEFYEAVKIIAISRIDKTATEEAIQSNIENDSAKFPELLQVSWPKGNPWPQNGRRPAGTDFGPLQVKILNKMGEALSQMPAVGLGKGKKMAVEYKIVHHVSKEDKTILCQVAQHSPNWGFAFKKMDGLTNLGKYTFSLNTKINETNACVFGGRKLPSFELMFTIVAGEAQSFAVGAVSATLNVGVPFSIPLFIKDAHDNAALTPADLRPVLKCSGLELSYETVNNVGTTSTIRGVKAKGKVQNYQQSKTYELKVTLPGLKTDTQTVQICLLPGNPHSLHVTPEDEPITLENGNAVTFSAQVHDEAGNVTAHAKQIVCCQVTGFPPVTADCSTSGAGQLVTKPINLQIINGEPQNLTVQFEMPKCKWKVPLVLRKLKVVPSTKVSHMELCAGDNLVLKNHEKIEWLAGGSLENLFYKLFDEAGRPVPPTAQIARGIKVNWTRDVNDEDLARGKLPVLTVPTQVQPALFYQVSYKDQSVSVSFNIVPRPDEPTQLKATLLQNTVKLGEILPGNIRLELLDQYDNTTKTFNSTCKNHITVEADGLDKSAIAFVWQESSSSVVVTGVQFRPGPLGPRELCFAYRGFEGRVLVKVTAGVPAQLKLVSGPETPLQVLNDHGIPTPFVVQLCDEWGNPTADQRVVVRVNSSPPTLKVTTAVISKPVNAEGRASFPVSAVSGTKGCYELVFDGSLNQKPIPGFTVNLTVIPDPNKPVSLSVEYNTAAVFPAGGRFPVFSVTVVSDEGCPMTTFNPAAASMLLWKEAPPGNPHPCAEVTELRCSKPTRNEKNDRFHFRDKEIPEQVGKYAIKFSLQIGDGKLLSSNQISIDVVANQPVRLAPDSPPPTPFVSDSNVIAHRTLVENMTLRIMDAHGNPAGRDLGGTVVVSIENPGGGESVPLFEGQRNSLTTSLVEGKAHFTRLVIMQNSPGENGKDYVLLFRPEGSAVPTTLDPFQLPFRFNKDAENQRTMFELTKKKNMLTSRIRAYKETFNTSKELLSLMTTKHLDESQIETVIRNELINRNVEIGDTIPEIDRILNAKRSEVDQILRTPRRVCSIPDQFRGQQDVLGAVGHLAFVQDDDAARVISWQLRGDMDCVLTKTLASAQRIYSDTRGQQQVMSLETMFVREDNRPLPHIRNGRSLFDPPGNPVYALDLLLFPSDPQSCRIAFKSILGNTILMDDLNSANSYRKAVVQHKMPCPTILTRQGDRISGNGKFGGAQNRAPPMHALKVFGAPLHPRHAALKEHIDLLSRHRAALEKREKAAEDREVHLKSMKSPDMLQKRKKMEDMKTQLEETERLLLSTPVRPGKRRLEGAHELSATVGKRFK